MRIGDADHARADLEDPPRAVPQLEDVAGVALDGEVLVERADLQIVGLEQHAIVGDVGDGAARGERRQPGGSAREQASLHFVAVDERGAPAAACGEAAGQHADDRVEVGAREVAVRPGATDQREQIVLAPLVAGGLGDQLLRQHVERRVVGDQAIQLAVADGTEQRHALDQVVARHRQQAALGRAGDRVAGAADALQERRNAMRRADLAHQVDVADVDAELERRGRDERLQLAALQPLLGVEAALLRQAAVMRGDGVRRRGDRRGAAPRARPSCAC